MDSSDEISIAAITHNPTAMIYHVNMYCNGTYELPVIFTGR